MDPADRRALARARAYPYRDWASPESGPPDAPEVTAIEPFSLGGGWSGGGPALIAFGANASPEVLTRKLGDDVRVTAVPATLHGFDIAYSAHIAVYGAIPATLVRSPGTAVAVAVLRMPTAALQALDGTEPNYVRTVLADGLEAYLSRHGALRLDGRRHAVAAVPARGRVLPALTQTEVLARVAAALEPDSDPDAFVLDAIRDAEIRVRRTRALRSTGSLFPAG